MKGRAVEQMKAVLGDSSDDSAESEAFEPQSVKGPKGKDKGIVGMKFMQKSEQRLND